MPTHSDDGLEWTIAIVHSAVRRAIECNLTAGPAPAPIIPARRNGPNASRRRLLCSRWDASAARCDGKMNLDVVPKMDLYKINLNAHT